MPMQKIILCISILMLKIILCISIPMLKIILCICKKTYHLKGYYNMQKNSLCRLEPTRVGLWGRSLIHYSMAAGWENCQNFA